MSCPHEDDLGAGTVFLFCRPNIDKEMEHVKSVTDLFCFSVYLSLKCHRTPHSRRMQNAAGSMSACLYRTAAPHMGWSFAYDFLFSLIYAYFFVVVREPRFIRVIKRGKRHRVCQTRFIPMYTYIFNDPVSTTNASQYRMRCKSDPLWQAEKH